MADSMVGMKDVPNEIVDQIAAALIAGHSFRDDGPALRRALCDLSRFSRVCQRFQTTAQRYLFKTPLLHQRGLDRTRSFYRFIAIVNKTPHLRAMIESITLVTGGRYLADGLRGLPGLKSLELSLGAPKSVPYVGPPNKLQFQHIERLSVDCRIRTNASDLMQSLLGLRGMIRGFTSLRHLEFYGESRARVTPPFSGASLVRQSTIMGPNGQLIVIQRAGFISSLTPLFNQLLSLVLPCGLSTQSITWCCRDGSLHQFTRLEHLKTPKEPVLRIGSDGSTTDPHMTIPTSIRSLEITNGDKITVQWVARLISYKGDTFPGLDNVTISFVPGAYVAGDWEVVKSMAHDAGVKLVLD